VKSLSIRSGCPGAALSLAAIDVQSDPVERERQVRSGLSFLAKSLCRGDSDLAACLGRASESFFGAFRCQTDSATRYRAGVHVTSVTNGMGDKFLGKVSCSGRVVPGSCLADVNDGAVNIPAGQVALTL